ncbi:sugar ABC transporter permease [Nonomuraea sp. KC401]|uniref:Sugar ABC transporter permease n=1 Tax=Nonomuraea longispora TaxID=1848320 RepID=A0A4R4N524_9ACTN|nr:MULTISPECIES: sugar ABC transporter permease [Nonomuraea]NBE96336.1 ABC transporter permease subunit [Nonomuraea sp. K271]TDC03889.1 sugar ABC transporter permease [Nonomuraea longispora]TLF68736.1 sugar ABC transporter permease [Nonomuraea sp. KC401]
MAQATSPPEVVKEDERTRRGYSSDAAGLGNLRAGAFVAPALLLIAAFLVFPALWVLYLGLTNYRLTGAAAAEPQFVGLANLLDAVSNPTFWNSTWLTLQFVLGSAVIGQVVLGFSIAWMLRDRAGPLKRLVEGLVILAWILPSAVVSFLWVALLDRDGGTLNALLGIPGFPWLLDHPMLSIIVFNTWRGTAFSMMLYGAALGNVPPSHLESARLAGASGWQQLRDVVFPHIRGHILTNLLLISLWTFNDFSPFLITAGGPDGRSEVLAVHVYKVALQSGELGYGAAVSTIILLINLVVAVFYLRLLRSKK